MLSIDGIKGFYDEIAKARSAGNLKSFAFSKSHYLFINRILEVYSMYCQFQETINQKTLPEMFEKLLHMHSAYPLKINHGSRS